LPKKLAIPFTKQEEQKLARISEQRTNEDNAKQKFFEEAVTKLNGQIIYFEVKASEDGTLYGGLSKKDLVEKIEKLFKINIKEEIIQLEKPLKKIGQHKLKLQFTPDLVVEVIVELKRSTK